MRQLGVGRAEELATERKGKGLDKETPHFHNLYSQLIMYVQLKIV